MYDVYKTWEKESRGYTIFVMRKYAIMERNQTN